MPSKSRPLLISCGILRKEIEKLIEEQSLDVEAYFLDAGLHVVYAELEKELTSALEESTEHAPNGIIVVYGDLCHPRIKKIVKKYSNAIKVDALNCIDCLLGGHKKTFTSRPKMRALLPFSRLDAFKPEEKCTVSRNLRLEHGRSKGNV